MAKLFCFYSSHEVLYGGCIQSLYVDAVVYYTQSVVLQQN